MFRSLEIDPQNIKMITSDLRQERFSSLQLFTHTWA